MEVIDGQKIRLAGFEPTISRCALAFWAMPITARVIGDLDRRTVVLTAQPVTAELSRPAAFDRRHDLQLPKAQMAPPGLPEGRPVSTEDVGDL
jgi:hypothetical protein